MGDSKANLDYKLDAPLDSLIKKRSRGGGGGGGGGDKELCRNFQRGECTRGSSCPYLHVEYCRDFGRGECPRGTGCPYLHKLNPEICRDFTLR